MDLPSIPELTKEQLQFVVDRLALNPHKLLETQAEFERFFDRKVSGSVIQRINAECKEHIEKRRIEIYSTEVNSIPIAHSFNILSLAQSRIEHLLKNEKTIRQNRKISEDGKEFFENETYADDVAMQNWAKIAQNERFLTLKLEIERIVKSAESSKPLPAQGTGFRPITINTGFSIDEEDSDKEKNQNT